MKKRTKYCVVIGLIIVLFIVSLFIYSSDANRAVTVNISNIKNDTEYLDNAYIDYNTEGKKVISCDILIKNNSLYNFIYSQLKGNDFDCISTGDSFEDLQLIYIQRLQKQTIHCFILVDENLTEEDLLHVLSNAYLEVMIDKDFKDNTDDLICELEIDNIIQ